MIDKRDTPLLFSGTSHPALAQEVADHLGWTLGKVSIELFPDREISAQVLESVRGRDVFVMQSVALSPNYFLMELLIIIDALRRASARSIVVIIPYMGYCRQDRKDRPRVPITAKLVANMLSGAGASRVLTMDLHTGQVQGFFEVPVDNLYGRPPLVRAIKEQWVGDTDLVVVAPDLGSIKLARAFARQLGVDLVVVDKRRVDSSNVAVTNVIGEVAGKDVLLADDLCSTAGTLVSAAKACREKGAKRIIAAVGHGMFVGEAIPRIEDSPIEQVFYCNTIPPSERLSGATKLREVSVASLFGRAIQCILSNESISSLFEIPEAVSQG